MRRLLVWLVLLSTSPAFTAPGSPVAIDIDSIEFEGVTQLTSTQLEAALEIGVGERLIESKLKRTAQNISNLYAARGFEAVSIETRLLRRKDKNDPKIIIDVVEFRVQEGLPTRIRSVAFTLESQAGWAPGLWDKVRVGFVDRVGLAEGDVLDQEKIQAARRTIQEAFSDLELIGARVVEVGATEATGGPGLPAARKWVNLQFVVTLGERVEFGFQGNQVFSHLELKSIISVQKSLGLGKDYIETLKTKIEDEYKDLGYAMVSVVPYTFENPKQGVRQVRYEIKEGPRVRLSELFFDGNFHFTSQELRSVFDEKAPLLIDQGYFVEKEVIKTAELVVEWMRSQGYLSAKLVSHSSQIVGEKSRTILYLFEGELTTVRSVSVLMGPSHADHPIQQSRIQELIGNHEGDPLNLYALNEGMETTKALYRSLGFLDMKIRNEDSDEVVIYSQDHREAEIQVEIESGPRYRVGRILVDGLGKTHEEVVRRQIQFQSGEYISEEAIIDTETRLRRLGVFAVVTVRTLDDPDGPSGGTKSIRISVQEGVPGVVGGGVGFRGDLGGRSGQRDDLILRAFGQFEYNNLWGRNHSFGVSGSVARRTQQFKIYEYQSQLSYLYPWFFLPELTFRPTVNVSQNQYLLFNAQNQSITGTFERRVLFKPVVTSFLSLSYEKIRQFDAQKFPEQDNQNLLIGSITPGIRLDTRDQPLNPTKGVFAQTSYEVAIPQISESRFPKGDRFPVAYTRFQFRSDVFYTFWQNWLLYLSFRTGLARNLVGVPLSTEGVPIDQRIGVIPLIKHFTLGGVGSLRGYRDQEINEQGIAVHGTLSYVNYRAQIDIPFAGALRLGPFLDAGNLLLDHYSFGGLKYGTGLGFHYPTPVGPVNLDWGFKLNQPGGDPYRFYFSVGII